MNIEQHKILISARQLCFDHLAIQPLRTSGFNRSHSTPDISCGVFRLRTPRQPKAAIAASDAIKRTAIVISKKVNVPRVNTFKAAAIAT
jgi:hypothetical protein